VFEEDSRLLLKHHIQKKKIIAAIGHRPISTKTCGRKQATQEVGLALLAIAHHVISHTSNISENLTPNIQTYSPSKGAALDTGAQREAPGTSTEIVSR